MVKKFRLVFLIFSAIAIILSGWILALRFALVKLDELSIAGRLFSKFVPQEDLVEDIAEDEVNGGESSGSAPLLGGDRDEHGCIPSAGYSWCEIKKKCLRVWEEPCEAEENSLEEDLRAYFSVKLETPAETLKLTISQNTGTHALGGVSEAEGVGGALWLAHNTNGKWVVDFDGNGTIPCSSVLPHNYPKELVSECWDETTNSLKTL